MKLHIGCGQSYRNGWVNVDINPYVKTDLCLDIDNKTWPWEDSSVDEIFCFHVLEHCSNYLHVLGEMWRVCKHMAVLKIGVPYVSNSRLNAVNPYHLHPGFNEHSFRFFDPNDMKGSANEINPIAFQTESVKLVYFPEWKDKDRKERDFARKHYWNVVRNVNFVLRAIKLPIQHCTNAIPFI